MPLSVLASGQAYGTISAETNRIYDILYVDAPESVVKGGDCPSMWQLPHPLKVFFVCTDHGIQPFPVFLQSFHSTNGPAYLFDQVINVTYGDPAERTMATGSHIVQDLFCTSCQNLLGWKYLFAFESDEKYKEDKFVLERAQLVNVNSTRGWDSNDEMEEVSLNMDPVGVLSRYSVDETLRALSLPSSQRPISALARARASRAVLERLRAGN